MVTRKGRHPACLIGGSPTPTPTPTQPHATPTPPPKAVVLGGKWGRGEGVAPWLIPETLAGSPPCTFSAISPATVQY